MCFNTSQSGRHIGDQAFFISNWPFASFSFHQAYQDSIKPIGLIPCHDLHCNGRYCSVYRCNCNPKQHVLLYLRKHSITFFYSNSLDPYKISKWITPRNTILLPLLGLSTNVRDCPLKFCHSTLRFVHCTFYMVTSFPDRVGLLQDTSLPFQDVSEYNPT